MPLIQRFIKFIIPTSRNDKLLISELFSVILNCVLIEKIIVNNL